MPELPEVETIVRHLRKKILGKSIVNFTSNTPRIFRDHKSFAEVRNQVLGKKIEGLDRTGKNILFSLSGNVCLSVHLMMTGRLLLDQPKQKHDRFEIKLSGGTRLVFNDIRKFGRCRIIENFTTLGEDALVIDLPSFSRAIKARNKNLKNFLLDQSAVSGIGNIYADEILWSAGIHPLRRTGFLKESETKNIYRAMKKVLRLAIKKGGTSSRNYQKPDGSSGSYYQIRQAYQMTGKPCSLDSVKIERIVVGGRSTHFCPKHQK